MLIFQGAAMLPSKNREDYNPFSSLNLQSNVLAPSNTITATIGTTTYKITLMSDEELKKSFGAKWETAKQNMELLAAAIPKIVECAERHREELMLPKNNGNTLQISVAPSLNSEYVANGQRVESQMNGTYNKTDNSVQIALGAYKSASGEYGMSGKLVPNEYEDCRNAAVHELSHYFSLNAMSQENYDQISKNPLNLEGLNQWAAAKLYQHLHEDKVEGFEKTSINNATGNETQHYTSESRNFAGLMLMNGFRQTLNAFNSGDLSGIKPADWRGWAKTQDAAKVENAINGDLEMLAAKQKRGEMLTIADAATFDRLDEISRLPSFKQWRKEHRAEINSLEAALPKAPAISNSEF